MLYSAALSPDKESDREYVPDIVLFAATRMNDDVRDCDDDVKEMLLVEERNHVAGTDLPDVT